MMKYFIGTVERRFLAISLGLLAAFFIHLSFFMPLSPTEKWKEVLIPEGSTYREGIRILKKEGFIKNEILFLVLGRLTMMDRRLRAGYYNLNTSMTPWEVFETLWKGRIVQFAITIPAGSTLEDIREKFLKAGLIDEESWQLVYDPDFLKTLGVDAPSLEGYIFPDTYNFAKGMGPEDIFKLMVQRMRENFDQSMRKRAEELGMSENEVLTLASIIEKEAIFDRERPLISAVYHNRLKRGMKLQADPTVLYGVKKKGRRIGYRDLRRETPYNTYVINGLPPGPIASPSRESIKAALYPAPVDYLFFVSKNDGTHYFSRTVDEHERAVTIYQRGNMGRR